MASSYSARAINCHCLSCSLVLHIEDLLLSLKTAVGHLELRLVERLGLVEPVAVRRAHHVRVQVLLSFPGGAVPALTVTLVATSHRVGPSLNFKLGSGLEDLRVITSTPVGSVVNLWAEEASPSRRGVIVLRLEVRGRLEHGSATVATASDLHSLVVLWDQSRIESNMKDSEIVTDPLTQWSRRH